MKSWFRSFARGAFALATLQASWFLGVAAGVTGGDGESMLPGLLGPAAFAALMAAVSIRRSSRRPQLPQPGSTTLALAFGALPGLLIGSEWVALVRITGSAYFDGLLVFLPSLFAVATVLAPGTRVLPAWLGAAVAQAALAFLAVPTLGWLGSVLLVGAIWWLAERGAEAAVSEKAPALGSKLASVSLWVWCLVGGAAAFFADIVMRQHIANHWWAVQVMVLAVLIGVGVGAVLGETIAGVIGRRWLLLAGAVLPVAIWSSFRMFRMMAGSEDRLPWEVSVDADGAVVVTAALTACWMLIGFPLVIWGAVLPLWKGCGRWLPWAAGAGLMIGAVAAELSLRSWNESHDGRPSLAIRLVPRRSLETVEVARAFPSGIATQRRERGWLDYHSVRTWRDEAVDRDPAWERLEALEVELPIQCFGRTDTFEIFGSRSATHWQASAPSRLRGVARDPLPTPESIEFLKDGGSRFFGSDAPEKVTWLLLLSGRHGSGSSLERTPGVLGQWTGRKGKGLWEWRDLRTLGREGVRAVLAGWKETFPDATLWVLQDGFAGPLLGMQVGGGKLDTDVAPRVVLLKGRMADLVTAEGSGASWNRPVLEWGAALRVPKTPHPRAASLRGLLEDLRLSPGAQALLEGLAIHAESQVEREMVQDPLERITLPAASIEQYSKGFAAEPSCGPLVGLVTEVARFLLAKQELELVVPWLEELVERRPDVSELHVLLGRAYVDILDPEGAAEELSLGLALVEDDSDEAIALKVELAKVLGDAGRWREATVLLEEVWARGTDLRVAKGLGLAYLELGQYEEARSFLSFVREQVVTDDEVEAAWRRLEEASDR